MCLVIISACFITKTFVLDLKREMGDREHCFLSLVSNAKILFLNTTSLFWVIYFNGISTCLWLFYAYKSENRSHCTLIFTFLCSCLRVFFLGECTWSYRMAIICKQIYLIHKGTLIGTTAPGQSVPGRIAMTRYSSLSRSPEPELHHQILFSLIPKIALILVGGLTLL